jgi:hypothetical protein
MEQSGEYPFVEHERVVNGQEKRDQCQADHEPVILPVPTCGWIVIIRTTEPIPIEAQ